MHRDCRFKLVFVPTFKDTYLNILAHTHTDSLTYMYLHTLTHTCTHRDCRLKVVVVPTVKETNESGQPVSALSEVVIATPDHNAHVDVNSEDKRPRLLDWKIEMNPRKVSMSECVGVLPVSLMCALVHKFVMCVLVCVSYGTRSELHSYAHVR
jgi:hypothetical protein